MRVLTVAVVLTALVLSASGASRRAVAQIVPMPSGPDVCTAGHAMQNAGFRYPPGWNLVAGPTGTVLMGNLGPVYAYLPGASGYQAIPPGTPLEAGAGYWAYFPSTTSGHLLTDGSLKLPIPLPAGRFIVIGNPFVEPVTIIGADIAYGYDPTQGYYAVTTLQTGQAAWAFSVSGGVVTFTPASPCG
jgi:hypothetical protein